jgi:ribonuclease HI
MNLLFADGFMCGSNPSPIGGGYTITDADGGLLARRVIAQAGFTNNEAELRGVMRAILLASQGDTVLTDSRVALGWIRRGCSRARSDLNPQLRIYQERVRSKKIELRWVPREKNLAGLFNEQQAAEQKRSRQRPAGNHRFADKNLPDLAEKAPLGG